MSSEEPALDTIDDCHNAYADAMANMAGNLYIIVKDLLDGKDHKLSGVASDIKGLDVAIQWIQNYFLNMLSRKELLLGYIKRVYVNLDMIEKRNKDAIMNDDEYMYGDTPICEPYAPLFFALWNNHMKDRERDTAWEFFDSFNSIVEAWIMAGGADLFMDDVRDRKSDIAILNALENTIGALDASTPKGNEKPSKEYAIAHKAHYAELAKIRQSICDVKGIENIMSKNTAVKKTITKKTKSIAKDEDSIKAEAEKMMTNAKEALPTKSASTKSASTKSKEKVEKKVPKTKEIVKEASPRITSTKKVESKINEDTGLKDTTITVKTVTVKLEESKKQTHSLPSSKAIGKVTREKNQP
jgi:hypothetical protein